MLLYHRRFIHNDTLELAIAQLLRASLADCSHDDGTSFEDLLLEFLLMFEELLELGSLHLLDSLHVAAEEANELIFQSLLFLPDEVSYLPLTAMLDFFFFLDFNISGNRHCLEELLQTEAAVKFFNLLKFVDGLEFYPTVGICLFFQVLILIVRSVGKVRLDYELNGEGNLIFSRMIESRSNKVSRGSRVSALLAAKEHLMYDTPFW